MAYLRVHGDPRTFPGADSYLELREHFAEQVDFAFVRKQEHP